MFSIAKGEQLCSVHGSYVTATLKFMTGWELNGDDSHFLRTGGCQANRFRGGLWRSIKMYYFETI